MVLTEKSILFPEGSFSANTVLFMYITLKQSPGHMPVAQQGPGWVRRGLLAAVGLAGDQAELVGSMHTEFQSQTRKRGVQRYGRAGHCLVTATSAGGKVAEMASKETAAAWRCRSHLGRRRSEAEWNGTEETY